MKLKRKNKITASVESGNESFFEAPRVEFLVDEIRESPHGQIGDLIANPMVDKENRLTLVMPDDCMSGAGIRNADLVVIEPQSEYSDGNILAVQLGTQQYVRRYSRAGKRISLQCDPPNQHIIIVEFQTPGFQILGQVIQVIREIR